MADNAIQKLFSNPIFKHTGLKILKVAFNEHNLKMITVEMDANGELNFEVYTDEMKTMKQTEFTEIQKLLTDGIE